MYRHDFYALMLLLLCSPLYAGDKYQLSMKEGPSLEIQTDEFKPKLNMISKCGDYVCAINGSPFYGSDGKIPNTRFTHIDFIIGKTRVSIDADGMYDPKLSKESLSDRFTIQHYWGDFYKVTARLSDGAGAYLVQWQVSKHGAIRTHISDYETLSDLHALISK